MRRRADRECEIERLSLRTSAVDHATDTWVGFELFQLL
jgi:hypothetical protein